MCIRDSASTAIVSVIASRYSTCENIVNTTAIIAAMIAIRAICLTDIVAAGNKRNLAHAFQPVFLQRHLEENIG